MTEMKTPGVYIVEKNAFPDSVVEVATAVPAFIGYTEKAENSGKSLLRQPLRITSIAEYLLYFGGAPQARFKLASSAPPAAAGKPTAMRKQVSHFKLNKVDYSLVREAGKAGGRFLMVQAMRHFFQNGGGPCYVVSVGDYNCDEISAGDDKHGLLSGIPPLLKEQEPTMVLVPDAVLLDEPACILVQQQVLKHCGLTMRNRVAILDVWGGDLKPNDGTYPCIDQFRNDIGINQLDFAAAYYPWLHTSLVQADDMDYGMFGDATGAAPDLVALITAEQGITPAALAGNPQLQARLDAINDLGLDDAGWVTKLNAEAAKGVGSVNAESAAKAKKDTDAIDAAAADPDPGKRRLKALLEPHKRLLQKSLASFSELFQAAMDEAREQMNLMPPAAAMAGLYTMVDNTRGVWKAPANISVANVVRPAVDISHADQESLNVTAQGKSINAIRSFIGEGVLVWGARTLDGNSLDWRYIHVRRTMIMLEESCRLAAKAMVFEPNAANTWVTIKSMISNFLTGIWKRGGLAGAVPDDAFSVHVGLGETMTPEDILEGILRVTVLVAISRPAEFIEITFQQQMQKS